MPPTRPTRTHTSQTPQFLSIPSRWTYLTPDGESKAGTTGIFLGKNGNLVTGVNLLGAVPPPDPTEIGVNYFPHFQVPGAPGGTKFDVFPGSPSITDHEVIVFKGSHTTASRKRASSFAT